MTEPAAAGLAESSGQSRLPNGAASLFAPGTTTPIPPFLAPASLRIAITAFCLGTLAGLALPRAALLLSTASWQRQEGSESWLAWDVWQSMTGSGEVVRPWQRTQLHFYLLAWSVFHLLEFVITARYNRTRLYSDCELEGRAPCWGGEYTLLITSLASVRRATHE